MKKAVEEKKANVSKFEDLQKKKKERSRHQQEGGGTFSFRHFSHVNFHDVKHSPPHSSMTRNLSCLSMYLEEVSAAAAAQPEKLSGAI